MSFDVSVKAHLQEDSFDKAAGLDEEAHAGGLPRPPEADELFNHLEGWLAARHYDPQLLTVICL